MNNFEYYNPVKIIFGKDSISNLKDLIPNNKNILITYGKGSIKNNGVYKQVINALKGKNFFEFPNIEPNPKYETLMNAVRFVKKNNIDFLLAVGGGSVIDGTKFIAVASMFTGDDSWKIVSERLVIKKAIPLGTVLTLPATGTEMNSIGVISNKSTKEKYGFRTPLCFPQFSILDPAVTLSLPKKQISNGVADAFIHVLEQYLTYRVNAPLQDRIAEGILLTLIEEGPKTLNNPRDYDSRANFMWCASQALNGLIACGVPLDFGTHQIGHELTALYGIEHAPSLTVIFLNLLKHQESRKHTKLLQYAKRVWKIEEKSPTLAIDKALKLTKSFFKSLNMPTSLKEVGIDSSEASEKISKRFRIKNKFIGEYQDIDYKQVADIILV